MPGRITAAGCPVVKPMTEALGIKFPVERTTPFVHQATATTLLNTAQHLHRRH